jgi:hypothetical protein
LRSTFDPLRTPKALLEGEADELAAALAVLEPLLGARHRLAAGLGWNLTRARFRLAEQRLAGARTRRARLIDHRLLLPDGEVAPPRLSRGGRDLRFVGYGRSFAAVPHQLVEQPGCRVGPGEPARYAYYRR